MRGAARRQAARYLQGIDTGEISTTVTYTPTGGDRSTESVMVKLIKR